LTGYDLTDEKTVIKRSSYEYIIDTLKGEIAENRKIVGRRVIDDLQRTADAAESPLDLLNRIRLLQAKSIQIKNLAEPNSVDAALADIIENALDGGAGVSSMRYKGAEIALSDLVSLAENTTNKKLLSSNLTAVQRDVFEGVIEHLRSLSGGVDETVNVLGKDYLDKFLQYTLGRTYAVKETNQLGSVPQIFDEVVVDFFGQPLKVAGETLKVAKPKPRIEITPHQIKLNPALTLPDSLGAVKADTDFLRDLIAISNESAEDIEELIRAGFKTRLQAKLPEVGLTLSDEAIEGLSTNYLNILRHMSALHKANVEVAQAETRLSGITFTKPGGSPEAVIDAAAMSPEEAAAAASEAEEERVISFIDDLKAAESAADDARGALGSDPIITLDDLHRSILDDAIGAEADAATAAAGGTATGKFTPIGEMLKKYMRGAGPKTSAFLSQNKGKIAIGAVATGLAVMGIRRSKDKSPEDISGPPLLPGGNPYENLPSQPINYPSPPQEAEQMGTSYNVSLNASQEEIDQFMERAGYLSNGQIQGTMHNTLPNLGNNSYDDIAGSF
jgi:hypothetical protein